MSDSTVTLKNAIDTWVNQDSASRNYAEGKSLGVKTQASHNAYAFLHFNRPFDLGATIISAKLRLYTKGSWGATPTITVKRANARWGASRVNYNSQPGVVGAAYTLSQSSAVDGHLWEIDITGLMQTVSNGGAYYGLRVESDATTLRYFYSANGNPDYRPQLYVDWSDAPRAPTTLSPSGGRKVSIAKPTVRFDFTDEVGSTALQAVQVQQNATNVWTDPTFDSGSFATTVPEMDLSTLSYVRTVSVTKTSGSPTLTVTAGALAAADVGATITGTGIPGATTITAATLAGTSATMSANASTSGTITATVTRTHPGIADAATAFWRVRVQDGAGLWSPWSDAAAFGRTNKPTYTITAPADSPNNFVYEWTPPFIVSALSAGTQVAIRWMLLDSSGNELWDSGRISGTSTSITMPKGYLVDSNSYTLAVKRWDSVDREATPGDPTFIYVTKAFTFSEDPTPASPTAAAATPQTPYPWIKLTWTRASAPDYYTVKRKIGSGAYSVLETDIDPVDTLISGTSNQWTDKTPPSGKVVTYVIQATAGGKTSQTTAGSTASSTVVSTGIWLECPDLNTRVFIAGTDSSDWTMGDDSAVFTARGSTESIIVTQGVRGYEGHIDGRLIGILNLTAREWRDNLLSIKGRPGVVCQMTVGQESFSVILHNVSVAPTGRPIGQLGVSFDFIQVGRNPGFTVRL